MGADDASPAKEQDTVPAAKRPPEKSSHISISKQVEARGTEIPMGNYIFVGVVVGLIAVVIIIAVLLMQPYSRIDIEELYIGQPHTQSDENATYVLVDMILTNEGDGKSGDLMVEVRAFERLTNNDEVIRHKKSVNMTPIEPKKSSSREINITVKPDTNYRFRIHIYEDEVLIEKGYTDITVSQDEVEEDKGYSPDYNQDQESADAGMTPAPGMVPSIALIAAMGLLARRFRTKV